MVITTNRPDCAWVAVSDSDWITGLDRITRRVEGTGNARLPYIVAPNTGSSRTGHISVNGRLVRITQDGAPAPPPPAAPTCTLDATNKNISQGGTSELFWRSGPSVVRVTPDWTNERVGVNDRWPVVLASSRTFTIICENSAGQRTTSSVTITVSGPSCPNTINYTPSGGPIALNETKNLRADWPTSGCGDPFWGSLAPDRGQIVGADKLIDIGGKLYPAGHNAVLRRIARGTFVAFVQANIPSPQPSRPHTWTDAPALTAPALELEAKAAIMFDVTPDGRVMYKGRPVEQTGPPRQ